MWLAFFLFAALIFGLCGVAAAQQAGAATTPTGSLNTAPGTLVRPAGGDLETMQSMADGRCGHPQGSSDMRRAMAIARMKELHKEVASQSAQLLVLGKKLNADVAKSNANQLSVSVVKESEEIEKLAKSIPAKTKNAYRRSADPYYRTPLRHTPIQVLNNLTRKFPGQPALARIAMVVPLRPPYRAQSRPPDDRKLREHHGGKAP